jgi:hypothetical protein
VLRTRTELILPKFVWNNPATYAYAKGEQSEKATLMENKWRVGDLQPVQGADPRAMSQIGFVLYDETGQPCVTFGYGSHDEARLARQYVMAALIGVETVRGLR